MFDLLEHRYGERWLEERREAERKQRQKNNKKVNIIQPAKAIHSMLQICLSRSCKVKCMRQELL